MMNLEISGKKYLVSTNLGVCYNIQNRMGETLQKIASDIANKDIKYIISVIFEGFKKNNEGITEEQFVEMIFNDEYFSYSSFLNEVSVFCMLCLSNEKDEKKVREKIKKDAEEREKELEGKTEEEKIEYIKNLEEKASKN